MDSGRHLTLSDEDGEDLALVVRVALLLASCALLFLGGLLGAGVALHSLRGPHQHRPCASETRETCM